MERKREAERAAGSMFEEKERGGCWEGEEAAMASAVVSLGETGGRWEGGGVFCPGGVDDARSSFARANTSSDRACVGDCITGKRANGRTGDEDLRLRLRFVDFAAFALAFFFHEELGGCWSLLGLWVSAYSPPPPSSFLLPYPPPQAPRSFSLHY